MSSKQNIKFESINLGTIGVKSVNKRVVSKSGIKTVQMGSCEAQVADDLSSQKLNLLPTNPWGRSITESKPVQSDSMPIDVAVIETVAETVVETVLEAVVEPVVEAVVEPVVETVFKTKMREAQYQKKLAKKNLKKEEEASKDRLYQKELSMKVDQANIVAQKAYDAAYEVNFIEYPKKEAVAKSEEVRKLAFEKELARLLPPAPVSEVKVSVVDSISSETDDADDADEYDVPPPSPVLKKVGFNPILPFSMIPASEVDLTTFTPVNGSKSKKEVDYKTSLLNARDSFAKALLVPHIKMVQAKFSQPSNDEKESFYFINVNTSTNDVLGKFEDTSFTKSKFMQNIKFAFSKYLARELETLTNLKLWVTIKKNGLEEHKYSIYLKLKQ